MILVGKQYPNTEKDELFVITELKKILQIDSTSFHAQIHVTCIMVITIVINHCCE